IGTRDPNPASGNGVAWLEQAGVEVVQDVGFNDASAINQGFFKWIATGRPYVTAKWAMSLDGKIATVTGRSRWITGTAARTRVHELRRRVDAVLIGAGTAIADDPELSVRLPGFNGRQPLRLVLDSRGRVSPGARLFEPDLPGSAIVATTRKMGSSHRKALEARGVECLILPSDGFDRVDFPALLTELGRRKISSLLIEGGGEVLGSAFDAGIVHELWAFVSPLIIGGLKAPTPVQGRGFPSIEEALRLDRTTVETVGEDFLVRGFIVETITTED
ncbi:MAG: bifunctional diaminohydroxyphosphoribosylaminopyrimidine deaminase/5-amino-6-(5-phosphoribosylamino)uracil reductase RibD, partial [Acidobacteria bacterium]|nr:bifunctional diaminohydroxyphosphoribosylaminopyrimidine deaminase/5-amino-6-(5-phosphoribosylamino)uracil reductase RibD [Acidobacteriota bacterium]